MRLYWFGYLQTRVKTLVDIQIMLRQCVDPHVLHHVFLLAAIPEDLQSRTLGLTSDGGEHCVMPGSGGRFITGI